MNKLIALLTLALAAVAPGLLRAADGRCRSIHIAYDGAVFPARAISVEATPDASCPGTFFCLMGFNGGCAGIQELNDGRRIIHFSVWDTGEPFNFSAHPEEVGDLSRTKVLANHPDAVISRGGDEGSVAKATLEYPWEVGKPIRLAVTSAPYGDFRTAYTCWVWEADSKAWLRVAAFATLVEPSKGRIGSCYAYVEDFNGTEKGMKTARSARFSRLWVTGDAASPWSSAARGVFTADSGKLTNFDGGTSEFGFWLATGGDTKNVTTRLWTKLPAGDAETVPACLADLARAAKEASVPPGPAHVSP